MKTIKSSEIASYVFCPVCWWNERINGVKVTNAIIKGEKYHILISENQSKARILYIFIGIVTAAIIFLIIYRFLK